MPFELDEPYRRLLDDARAVAVCAEPLAVEADAMSTIHPGMLAILRDSGLSRHMIPRAHGGYDDDVDPLAICLIREALMGVSSHLDSLFALQGIGSYAISRAGSEEQRSQWLPQIATAEALPALALTEPDAGSDLKAIQTTLTADGDELHLSGAKAFISNAGAAAFYTTLVREGDGFSLVLVPSDAVGVTISPVPELIAPHVLGDVTFSDVVLDGSARLGPAGGGFDLVFATLAVFRVSVAGAAVGLAQAALVEAERHARERIQFGRPLARLGAVATMLADSWVDIEMARMLTYRAAERAKVDPLAALPHSSMAKLAASEAAGRVVDRCIQIMGRFGLVRDSKIERLYRQARPMRVYEGSSEVLRLGIAKALGQELG